MKIFFFLALVLSLLVFSAPHKSWGFEADSQTEVIKAAISGHSNEVRMCYRDNEKKLKGAQGKISIDLEVNEQGALIQSAVNEKKSTLKNEILTRCLFEKIKKWEFPAAPKGQTIKVTYPFVFKKGN